MYRVSHRAAAGGAFEVDLEEAVIAQVVAVFALEYGAHEGLETDVAGEPGVVHDLCSRRCRRGLALLVDIVLVCGMVCGFSFPAFMHTVKKNRRAAAPRGFGHTPVLLFFTGLGPSPQGPKCSSPRGWVTCVDFFLTFFLLLFLLITTYKNENKQDTFPDRPI